MIHRDGWIRVHFSEREFKKLYSVWGADFSEILRSTMNDKDDGETCEKEYYKLERYIRKAALAQAKIDLAKPKKKS